MSSMSFPGRGLYRKLKGYAHTHPAYFYAFAIAGLGPLFALVVPPVRRSLGYLPKEPLPESYPVPNRPRRAVQGYED